MSIFGLHYRLERKAIGLVLGIILVSSIGGLVEIAPLFTIPIGLLAVQLAAAPRRVVVLIVLAEICAGLAVLGITRSDDRATESTL